jgi:ribosomal protein L32
MEDLATLIDQLCNSKRARCLKCGEALTPNHVCYASFFADLVRHLEEKEPKREKPAA